MNSTPLMILVAGPYRSGTNDEPDRMRANLRALEVVALRIYRAGHIPMIGEWVALPLLDIAGSTRVGDELWEEMVYPVANRLLTKCDGVLRLAGASKGADNDVRLAHERGIPVYYRIEEVPGVSCATLGRRSPNFNATS